jgi:hypothetical protein
MDLIFDSAILPNFSNRKEFGESFRFFDILRWESFLQVPALKNIHRKNRFVLAF